MLRRLLPEQTSASFFFKLPFSNADMVKEKKKNEWHNSSD